MRVSLNIAVLLLALSGTLAAQARDTTRADTTRASARLAPVTVTGGRLSAADVRAAHRVHTLDPLAVAPGTTAAVELLRTIPGVSLFDDQGARSQPELNLRGFIASPVVGEPQGISVFLDGVRINEPDAQEINFDLIPMDAVQRAELVRGPSSIFGKNTLAGALLLFTDRGARQPELSADVEAGAFGQRGARITGSGMVGGFDGYVTTRLGEEDGWRDQTASRTRSFFATLGRRRGSSDVALSVMVARDKIFEAGSLPESYLAASPRLNYTGGDFFQPELWQVSVRGERALGGGIARGNAFVRHNDIEQYNGNVPPPNSDGFIRNVSAGATAEWTRAMHVGGIGVTLTTGGEYERDDVAYRFFAVSAPGVPADPERASDAGCDGDNGLCTKVRVQTDNAALYAQATVALTPRLDFTAAGRADYVRIPYRDQLDANNDGTNSYTRISPRVGLAYRLADVRSFVAFNTGFRAPAALELACASADASCSLPSALGADPPLDPVTVFDYEGGVSWSASVRNSIDVVLFRSDVRNDILFTQPSATRGYFQNVDRTRREGVELSGALGLPWRMRAFGSYAYVAATYRTTAQLASALDDPPPVTPGKRFPLSPLHRATVGFAALGAIRSAVVDGALTVRGASSQYLRGDEANVRAPLPGFAVTDLRASVTLDRVRTSVSITNLFDRRYTTFGIYAVNAKGPLGGAPPADEGSAPVERFLTPGFPRALTVAVTVTR